MRASSKVLAASVGFWLTLSAGCAGAPPRAATTERRLVEAKAQIMAADYRADLAALARARDSVVPVAGDPLLGYLAHYWAGFASWRLAINGVNRGISPGEVEAHLERAVTDLDAAIRLQDDFAEGYAAAASVTGWLGTMQGADVAKFRELVTRASCWRVRRSSRRPILGSCGSNPSHCPAHRLPTAGTRSAPCKSSVSRSKAATSNP
jgi:hypothetical protein